MKKFYIILIGLILLTPLGLLAEGTAWGEWSAEDLKQIKGFVPEGIKNTGNIPTIIFPDYTVKALKSTTLGTFAGYIISAFTGIVLIIIVFTLFTFFMRKE